MTEAASDPPDAKARPRQSLTEGPVGGHLRRMTVPMIWGLLAVFSFNLVDTFFIAQLGALPLAAMGFCFPVMMVFFAVSIGMSVGASSIVARAIGEGDPARVQRLATVSMVLALLVVVLVSTVGLLTIDPLFKAMGAGPDVLPMIRDYMTLWYLGYVLLMLPIVGNGCIRATGNAKFPAYVMIVAAVINVILDPIFIFGLFGAPRLELEGAAVATLIARFGTLAAGLWVFHYAERLATWRLGTPEQILRQWGRVLSVALPASATNMVTPAAMMAVTALVALHGPEAVAAFGVASRIESMALIVMLAMSSVVGPIAGQNWGASRHDRVSELVSRMCGFALIYCLGVAVLVAAAAPLVTPFFSDSAQVHELATLYLWIVPMSFVGYGVMMNCAAVFNAIGRAHIGLTLALFRMVVVYLPLAALFSGVVAPGSAADFGVIGVFFAAFAANALAGIAATVWIGVRAQVWLWAPKPDAA